MMRHFAVLPIVAIAAAGFLYDRSERAAPRAAQTLAQPAPAADGRFRIAGTISALKSASLTAPRIQGSRSALNRGGDFNSGGSAPSGGASADFNLVLLTLATPGARVKAGDVVARFDPQNQLQRLDDYKNAVTTQENTIRSLTASLAAAAEAANQSVRTAKAAWDKASLDLKTAPVLNAVEAEKVKLTAEEAEAAYRQLVIESGLVNESQKAQIRAAELTLAQAKGELTRAHKNVELMNLKAPIDGIAVMATVVRNGEFGQIREGDQVYAGQPVLTIVDPDSMVLEASMNQVDAERLALGMQAVVRLDAYPEVELAGVLDGIGAMAVNSTIRVNYVGQIPVRVRLNGFDPRVIPDLTGSAEFAPAATRTRT